MRHDNDRATNIADEQLGAEDIEAREDAEYLRYLDWLYDVHDDADTGRE